MTVAALYTTNSWKNENELSYSVLICQTYLKNNLEQLYYTYIQGKAKQASFQSKGSNDAIPYLSSVKTLLVVAEFGIRGSQTPAFLWHLHEMQYRHDDL